MVTKKKFYVYKIYIINISREFKSTINYTICRSLHIIYGRLRKRGSIDCATPYVALYKQPAQCSVTDRTPFFTPSCIQKIRKGVCMEVTQIMPTVLYFLAIVILPSASAYAISFLKKKMAALEKNTLDTDLGKYWEIAENAIISCVSAVNQIYVDSIKKSNGFLTPDEQKIAFSMAKSRVLAILGDSGIKVLGKLYNDVNAWLDNRIEYQVRQAKNSIDH